MARLDGLSRERALAAPAGRERALAAPAALLLTLMAMIGLALAGSHRDARHDLEARFAERAAATAALVDALLGSTAKQNGVELSMRYGTRRVSSAALDAAAAGSQSVYELVAAADGRVLAGSSHTPIEAAARAGGAARRLGFPGAPPYLLWSASDQGGRALIEIAVPFRAGKVPRVHLAAVPARVWAGFFDPTLRRALRDGGARALVLDDRGRILGDSAGTRHPGAPYGTAVMREAGGDSPVSARSPIGATSLHVVYVTSSEKLYAPIGGRANWASWLAFVLAAAAMIAGLWLTARLRASHAALWRSEQRYALALRGANDGIWDWDLGTGRVHYSDRWAEMLGEPAPLGDAPDTWLDRVHPEDREELDAAIAAHLSGATPFLDHEHRLLCADGEWMWALVRGLAVTGEDGQATRMAGSLSDITGRRRALARLEHQASHDSLTGLANRSHFFSVLERALERSRHGGQPACGVVFLDLDGFKLVNDSHGHVFGDAVLATVADRLRHSVRPGDVVGRLGGDELAVLLPTVADEAEAELVAERLSEALAEPYVVLGEPVSIAASSGVAVAGPDDSAEDILREADAAMYRSKLAV